MGTKLEVLLANSRKIKGEALLSDFYIKYYDIIKLISSNIFKDFHYPEFIVIYSVDRKCETFEFENKKFIVYDQYLGQTFNQLTRIYLNSTTNEDSYVYGYKLFSEYLQLKGNSKLSFAFAYLFNKHKERTNSYKNEIDGKKRNRLTYVQEIFVLSHELSHTIYKNAPITFSSAVKEKIKDELEESNTLLKKWTEINDDKLDLVIEQIIDTYFPGDEIAKKEITNKLVSSEQKRIFLEQQAEKNKTLHKEFASSININDLLVEEIFCDELALNFTFQIAEKIEIPFELCVEGIYLAMLNMRLLSTIDKSIHCIISNTKIGENFHENIFRSSNVRKYVSNLYILKNKNVNQDKILTTITNINKRYSKIVQDSIIFDLTEYFRDISLKDEFKSKVPYKELIKMNSLIDKLLGNENK